MNSYESISLTTSLQPGKTRRAVVVLQAYFSPEITPETGYTGGAWDTFDPTGTRDQSTNMFTPDDLVACSLLGTPIGGTAALELLNPQRSFSALLRGIGADLDFAELTSTRDPNFEKARALFSALKALPDVGETRATKLLARKRPKLVPIVDSVITTHIFNEARTHWQPLHEALTANDWQLWKRLVELHKEAGLHPAVSTLRVFDVLAWMDGTGNSDKVLRRGLEPSVG